MSESDTSKTDARLRGLLRWPMDEDGVSVDLMLRHIGADAQMTHLDKWRILDGSEPKERTPEQHRLHQLACLHEVSAVGLMAAIRKLREVDEAAALDFVRDYWLMCDAGDAFGEFLWQWLAEAGLDPELLKLAEPAQGGAQ